METGIDNRIEELRRRYKMTKTELNEKLGLSHSMISHYELKKRTPSVSILIQLADIFNVSIDYILCRDKHITGLDELSPDELNEAIDYIKFRRSQKQRRLEE